VYKDIQKKRFNQVKHQRILRIEFRKKIDDYFGETCWNCGRLRKEKQDTFKHEINCLRHKPTTPWFYFKYREQFVQLCYRCHNAFHALAGFGYGIEEILLVFKWEEFRQ